MDERSGEFVVGDLAERDRHPVVVFGKSVGAEFAAAELRRPSSVADAADPLVARQLDIDDAPCAEEERIVGFEVDPPVEPVSRPGGHGDARPAFGVAEIEHVAVPDAGAGALRDDDSLDGNPVVGEAGSFEDIDRCGGPAAVAVDDGRSHLSSTAQFEQRTFVAGKVLVDGLRTR